MISGGKLAELGDGSRNDTQSEIDVGLRGVTAQTETKAGASVFGGQTDRGQYVRRLNSSRRTRGAGGTRQTFEIERNKESFAFDTGKHKIRGVGGARGASAIDARMRYAVKETVLELIAECA